MIAVSATGTRPPLFDPDPDDGDIGSAPRFPLQRTPRGGRRRGKGDSSPAWVRPFIFGGLVLIAILSLASILTSGGDGAGADDPSADALPADAQPADAQPADEPAPADDVAVEADPAAAPDRADEQVAEDPVAEDLAAAAAADDASGSDPDGAIADAATSTGRPHAEAFAVQFAHDYLNFDAAAPEVRERELAAYLAPGLDPQLGWDGQGSQLAVLTVPVASRAEGERTVVTVAAQVTGRDAPRWVHLDVPLVQDGDGRWAVVAPPAFVPRPQAGSPSVGGDDVALDAEIGEQLQPRMTQLFTAYASQQAVEVDGVTVDDAAIRGLGGQVELAEVGTLEVEAGDADRRTARITVSWADEVTASTLSQAYVLTLVGQGGDWLVESIAAS